MTQGERLGNMAFWKLREVVAGHVERRGEFCGPGWLLDWREKITLRRSYVRRR